MRTEQLWLLCGAGLAVSFLYTPLFIRLAQKLGIVDKPAHRKIHQQPIAYFGGLSVFASLFTVLGISLLLSWSSFSDATSTHLPFKNISVFIAGTLMALWGLIDDIYGLKPRGKLMGQLVIALLFASLGFRFEVLHLPGLHPYDLSPFIAIPLTTFWILSIVNALNLVDGIDGLATSVTITSFLLLAAASALLGQGVSLALALVVIGVLIGFLFYNWKPARVYLGESGSSGLGMLLAGFLLALGRETPLLFRNQYPDHTHQPFFYQIIILTLFVAYPALEITLSVARRLFRGKPIHRADQGHVHHRLLKKGWPISAIVFTAVISTLLPGLVALATLMNEHGLAAWFFGFSCLILGGGLTLLGFLNFLQPHAIAHSRPHYLIANHFIGMQKLKLQLSNDIGEIIALVNQACNEFGVQGYKLFVPPDEKGHGGCHYYWERSPEEHREHLSYLQTDKIYSNLIIFKDHITINNPQGEAFWIFEPHTEEEELDVEYRVLISEFMKESLTKIAELNIGSARKIDKIVALNLSPRKNVSSSSLRRRNHKNH